MEYGYIKIKVQEMRLKKGMSKNKLCYAAELERKQLNAYCQEKIARVDLGSPGKIMYCFGMSGRGTDGIYNSQ